ncbi:LPXTG cell wall anchor domain-containing protein [Pseudoxanthomonas wuyuanensis]
MRRPTGLALLLSTLFLLVCAAAVASPGAHGPNGEHLDGPSGAGAAGSDGRPRTESYTELFELVAHLDGDAVTAMINRYETNEPVDGAEVELEAGDHSAKASFDPQTGIYRFADRALLAALSEPGEHALVFTVSAADDIDLISGTLAVGESAHEHASSGTKTALMVLAGFALAAVLFFYLRRRRLLPRTYGGRA